MIRSISEKTARFNSNLEFLGKYHKKKVPKGLVWTTQPSFGERKPKFLKKWKNFQHKSSLHLVELNIEALKFEVRECLMKGQAAKELL